MPNPGQWRSLGRHPSRWKDGDRVEMVQMHDDPDPIPPGTRGTVKGITWVSFDGGFWQLLVVWDNGRTLMPCVPPDLITKVQDV